MSKFIRRGSAMLTKKSGEVRLMRAALFFFLIVQSLRGATCGAGCYSDNFGDPLRITRERQFPARVSRSKNVGTGQTRAASQALTARVVSACRIYRWATMKSRRPKMGSPSLLHRGIELTVGVQSVVDFSLAVGQQTPDGDGRRRGDRGGNHQLDRFVAGQPNADARRLTRGRYRGD